MRLISLILSANLTALSAASAFAQSSPPRNLILFVPDGLRGRIVTSETAPAMAEVRDKGVNFKNSHSLFPTFTTANASAMATGHYLGDTGDFSNTIYTGYPVEPVGGTVVPFLENNAVLETTPAPRAITRTVIAATKLSIVTGVPLYFKAVSVTLPSGEKSSVSAANGIVYQISGSTEVSLDGETKMLSAGEGFFIAGGRMSVLKAVSGGLSNFLHFFLAPAADLDRPAESAPAAMRELYRTAAPIPDLKPGDYDLNLTRVTFPAQTPSNLPHHRSGAALYFVISGTGANTVDGTTSERAPGSLIYEPYALVHQWGNPGSEPLTFLAFNINPEGVAAVLPGPPPKNQ
jgi:quercetin dioxygenase-like cupin family protein